MMLGAKGLMPTKNFVSNCSSASYSRNSANIRNPLICYAGKVLVQVRLQQLYLVKLLPGEVKIVAAEVAVSSCLAVDGTAQV